MKNSYAVFRFLLQIDRSVRCHRHDVAAVWLIISLIILHHDVKRRPVSGKCLEYVTPLIGGLFPNTLDWKGISPVSDWLERRKDMKRQGGKCNGSKNRHA